MAAKLKLIKSQAKSTFHILNKLILTRDELVMITLAWEIADEVFNFSGDYCRLEELYNDIKENSNAYIANGRTVFRGLNLIMKEVEKRSGSKYANNVKPLLKKIADALTTMAGVNDKDLLALPSLDVLHTQKHVHLGFHQHFVEEKKWNLT